LLQYRLSRRVEGREIGWWGIGGTRNEPSDWELEPADKLLRLFQTDVLEESEQKRNFSCDALEVEADLKDQRAADRTFFLP
jgi:hypothetical protein